MRDIDEIALHYMRFNPESAGKALEKCPIDDRIKFLSHLPEQNVADFLPHLPAYLVISYLRSADPKKCYSILQKMTPTLSSAYLRRVDVNHRNHIIALYPEDQRQKLETTLTYLPETAGHYMDTSVQPMKIGTSVGQALDFIKRKSRVLYYIYIVDNDDKLVGVLTIRRAVQETNSETMIEDIMETGVSSLFVDDGKQEILKSPHWSRFFSLPVVDYDGRYLGVVRYETQASLRENESADGKVNDLDEISQSLSELYGIGFSALMGSASTLLPGEDINAK